MNDLPSILSVSFVLSLVDDALDYQVVRREQLEVNSSVFEKLVLRLQLHQQFIIWRALLPLDRRQILGLHDSVIQNS